MLDNEIAQAEGEIQQTEEVAAEQEVSQTEETAAVIDTVPKSELDKVLERAIKAELELANVKQTQSGYDKAFSKVNQDNRSLREQLQSIELETMIKKGELINLHNAGELDETQGSLRQQLGKVENEAATAKAKTQAEEQQQQAQNQTQSYGERMKKKTFDLLIEAGLDPMNLKDPLVAEVNAVWNKAVVEQAGFEDVIEKATRIAAQKAKPDKPAVDAEALRAAARQEGKADAIEQLKQSPVLKIPSGKGSSGLSDADFLERYNIGELNDPVSHKRAAQYLAKLKSGG